MEPGTKVDKGNTTFSHVIDHGGATDRYQQSSPWVGTFMMAAHENAVCVHNQR